MKDKTKVVSIGDDEYQLKRFAPDVGAFILNLILNAGAKAIIERMKLLRDIPPPDAGEKIEPPAPDPDGEVRRMASTAFGGMTFEQRSMVQKRCLDACARMEEGSPMPIVAASGPLIDDLQVIMRLELEVLAFNFTDFFAAGGLNALLKTAIKTAPPH